MTGHRALPAGGAAEAGVSTVLDRLDVPGVVVSALAEGADRLVAEMALDRGYRLEAVLPLAADDYATDFPATADHFRALLARAEAVVELAPSITREEAYARAGHYVAESCDLLVAVWDGRPARGPGGTAEIVERARALGRPVAWVEPESGEVRWESA